jgi:hypothetical protein
MGSTAARIGPRLLAELVRIDDGRLPIAEVNRRLGEAADGLGLRRPSYERVRVVVHSLRRYPGQPSTAQVLFEVATRARSPRAIAELAAGSEIRPLP